jgi:hypothetical protein
VLGQYLFGVEPLLPGFKLFRIDQHPALFKSCNITIPSVAGEIASGYVINPDGTTTMRFTVPDGTEALVYFPATAHIECVATPDATPDATHPIADKLCYRFPAGSFSITY